MTTDSIARDVSEVHCVAKLTERRESVVAESMVEMVPEGLMKNARKTSPHDGKIVFVFTPP